MMAKHQKRQKMNFIRRLLVKNNHLTRALCMSGICRQSVRTGLKPIGVLKRVCISCEKPNDQPVYLTVPVGHWPEFIVDVDSHNQSGLFFLRYEKNVVGIANPVEAAKSRKPYSLTAIFSSGVPFMAGWTGKPKGLLVPHQICDPVSVCHHFSQRVMAVTKTAIEAHIMTTQSKVTPARRTRKTKAVQSAQPIQLTRERISTQGWSAYHEFVGNLTRAEMSVVGHLTPLTFPSPQAVINEARRLLGESIAKCKVIPFPVVNKQRSAQKA